MKSIFITGTDTDVGKTLISSSLLYLLSQKGYKTIGFKPVAAGSEMIDGELKNDDAHKLQQFSNLALTYNEVNPVLFSAPIAPHIAAKNEGVEISLSALETSFKLLVTKSPDYLLTEGAGGWFLPLNSDQNKPVNFLYQLPINLKMDVILVVGLKLGCLNHALLTADKILSQGLNIIGWVGNTIDNEMLVQTDNIETLNCLIDAPCLGIMPHLENVNDIEAASRYLDISQLVN